MERGEELLAALRRLAEPYRKAVTLRFYGGLSLAEIAEATGSPLGIVKGRLFRGLGHLRLAIEAPEGWAPGPS